VGGAWVETEVAATVDCMRCLGCADLDRAGVRRRNSGCQADDDHRRHDPDDDTSDPA
jgi:hypothetical protein